MTEAFRSELSKIVILGPKEWNAQVDELAASKPYGLLAFLNYLRDQHHRSASGSLREPTLMAYHLGAADVLDVLIRRLGNFRNFPVDNSSENTKIVP